MRLAGAVPSNALERGDHSLAWLLAGAGCGPGLLHVAPCGSVWLCVALRVAGLSHGTAPGFQEGAFCKWELRSPSGSALTLHDVPSVASAGQGLAWGQAGPCV